MDSKRRRTGGDTNTNTQCYTDSYTGRDTAAYSDAKSSSYAAAPADYSFPPIALKCQQPQPNDEKRFKLQPFLFRLSSVTRFRNRVT